MSKWDGRFEALARSGERELIPCGQQEKEALVDAAEAFAARRDLHVDPGIKMDGVQVRFWKTKPKA